MIISFINRIWSVANDPTKQNIKKVLIFALFFIIILWSFRLSEGYTTYAFNKDEVMEVEIQPNLLPPPQVFQRMGHLLSLYLCSFFSPSHMPKELHPSLRDTFSNSSKDPVQERMMLM